jgi:hypothetical protein
LGWRRHHCRLAEASKTHDFKALQLKRKAWGGREEDYELTYLLTEAIEAATDES